MSDSRFLEFVKIFQERVRESRLGEPDADGIMPLAPKENAFTTVFLEDMEDMGLIPDSHIVYYEKKLGRANGKINGYAITEDESKLHLCTSVLGGESDKELKSAPAGEITKAINAAVHVYRAAKEPLHLEMEEAFAERDMVERLHSIQGEIGSITVHVLINGATGKIPDFEQPKDLPEVVVDVWDIERLYRAASSDLAYESVAIDMEKILGSPLSCLPGPTTDKGYCCYFAIIPGELLFQLYHEHGPRLLELNVRSFLQARGKVNRGIRDTLRDDPEYFLAYNNGISATVESLDLIEVGGVTKIRNIKGLQIVNGGQTMASIHRAKDRDKLDLSNVYVQAKITKIDSDQLDTLVPNISRFSNTQNKVNETDFSANHPFHVKFQQLSESVWPPGETTRWFYERARGQWEVARIREGTTPVKLRTFDHKTPRKQKVDKNLLAKSINTWNELPHIVSQGGQKCFIKFMQLISENGTTWEPDDKYFRDSIAKVIIFKKAETIARQIGFSAYRANAVCFTVSLLAYRTGGRINFDKIWVDQNISEELESTLREWMPEIHEEIVNSAGEKNVTEWCKKKDCWATIQSMDLILENDFEQELVDGQPLPTVGSKARNGKVQVLSPDERRRQAKIMQLDGTQWHEIISWMKKDKEKFSGFPMEICATVLAYAEGGWQKIPSAKQTKHLIKYLNEWETESKLEN